MSGFVSLSLFGDKHDLVAALPLSLSVIKRKRLSGEWLPGVHFVEIGPKTIRYNITLIADWLANRHDPTAHLRAIEAHRLSLLGNQLRRSGRPAGAQAVRAATAPVQPVEYVDVTKPTPRRTRRGRAA